MAGTLKVKVSCSTVVTLSKDDYRDAYLEYCEEEGDEPEGETPTDFVVEKYQEALDDGNEDLSTVFENAPVTLEIVK